LKNNGLKRFGEYRTRRLVLQAWQQMEVDRTFERLGLSERKISAISMPQIELPPLSELPDGAWAWPGTIQPADRIRYAAQYALWLADPDRDGENLRWAIACMAEPALLTPWLDSNERAGWIRLMGPEAQTSEKVVRLRPQINRAWREAFGRLIATGQLQEGDNGEWQRGEHFVAPEAGADSPHARRAKFVLDAIRWLDMERIRESTPQEDRIIWQNIGYG